MNHPTTLPETARIPEAVRLTGLSRSAIYREAAAGRVRLLKHGRNTLVDLASVRSLLASLPPAPIRAAQRAA